MFPPPVSRFRQAFAHRMCRPRKLFARDHAGGQSTGVDCAPATRGPICPDRYPSPIHWPDPARIRPIFMATRARRGAVAMTVQENRFPARTFLVIIEPIKTKQRGTNRCDSISFFFLHWLPPLWRAVCRTPQPVVSAARLPVPPSQMRWMKILSPVRPLARLVVQRPATSPARCSADNTTELNACGRFQRYKNHPGLCPGGSSHSRTR